MTFGILKHIKLKFKYTILFVVVVLLNNSCKKVPQYPLVPEIEFLNIELREKSIVSIFDTIVFKINFKDGDGNLGLTTDQTEAPFNDYNFVYDNFSNRKKFGDPSTPFYNKYDYEIIGNDTFLVERNPYFYNFNILYFIENSNGNFVFQDYRDLCINQNICQPFSGRFAPISEKDEPLEGVIEYFFQSSQFPKARIKFQINIYDRALNISNTVETTILDLR